MSPNSRPNVTDNGKSNGGSDYPSSSNVVVDNYIAGAFVPPSTNEYLNVTNPASGAIIGKVGLSNRDDVDTAVRAAQLAFGNWSEWTIKARAAVMLKFHGLVREHAHELAECIVQENGKNITEALADVAKGNETVEYACSLPQLAQGKRLQVSSGGVYCTDERRPLGVVACIVPFNFPFMVPFWTIPIALIMGNCVILKPSEKVPLTMHRVASKLIQQAGFPDGVFNMVQGSKDAVQALLSHPDIAAVTFVGSSPVAKLVSESCRHHHKRCTALGGAKNHLIALPDCDVPSAASDICVSFAGCAGQRCMAASVLLLIGEQPELLNAVVEHARQIQPGTGPGQMGPVIDEASYQKIVSHIQDAEENQGAKVMVDGRAWKREYGGPGSNWIGPTVLLFPSPDAKTMREEVFGPVLSVYVCDTWDEAIAIENANEFGNAACIYTTNGAHADWFTSRFRSAMLGVNIGIPVPREPFSFGGLYGTHSKYGDMDITGDAGMEFFSNRIKITSKWPAVRSTTNGGGGAANTHVGVKRKSNELENGTATSTTDHAHFSGNM